MGFVTEVLVRERWESKKSGIMGCQRWDRRWIERDLPQAEVGPGGADDFQTPGALGHLFPSVQMGDYKLRLHLGHPGLQALQIPSRTLKVYHFWSLPKGEFWRKAIDLHLEVSDT